MAQKTERPSSHVWLILAIVVFTVGALMAMVEFHEKSSFGMAVMGLAGVLFSVGVLVELFSIGSTVRRIEAGLAQRVIASLNPPLTKPALPEDPGHSKASPSSSHW